MGRYISGDIEDKCWFGIQPSEFADRFGKCGEYPQTELDYTYTKEDLPKIEHELKQIEKKLGEYLIIFKNLHLEDGYNIEDVRKHCGLNVFQEDKLRDLIAEYADYLFGIKLRDFLKENEVCCFSVEL